MRKINTHDVFKASRLIKHSGVKEEFKSIFSKKDATSQEIGFETIFNLFEALTSEGSEDEIYEIIADVCEMKPDDIASMDLDEMMDLLDEIGKNNDLSRFFSYVGRLIG